MGEARVSLPALPEFVELLRARGRAPSIERLEREPRRFASRDELEGFLRRQLWVEPGSAADAGSAPRSRLVATDDDGRVGLVGQRPLPIGIVTWEPGGSRDDGRRRPRPTAGRWSGRSTGQAGGRGSIANHATSSGVHLVSWRAGVGPDQRSLRGSRRGGAVRRLDRLGRRQAR